jgi:hypothetical protein
MYLPSFTLQARVNGTLGSKSLNEIEKAYDCLDLVAQTTHHRLASSFETFNHGHVAQQLRYF